MLRLEYGGTIRMICLGVKRGQVSILLLFFAPVEELRLAFGRLEEMPPQESDFQLE